MCSEKKKHMAALYFIIFDNIIKNKWINWENEDFQDEGLKETGDLKNIIIIWFSHA